MNFLMKFKKFLMKENASGTCKHKLTLLIIYFESSKPVSCLFSLTTDFVCLICF